MRNWKMTIVMAGALVVGAMGTAGAADWNVRVNIGIPVYQPAPEVVYVPPPPPVEYRVERRVYTTPPVVVVTRDDCRTEVRKVFRNGHLVERRIVRVCEERDHRYGHHERNWGHGNGRHEGWDRDNHQSNHGARGDNARNDRDHDWDRYASR